MRSGAIYSGLLHLAILLLIVLGLPDIFKHDEEIAAPVAVQLATLADITSTPHPAPQSQPRPRPVTKPTPPPPAPKAPEPPPSAQPQAQPTPPPQQPAEQAPPAPSAPTPLPPPPLPPQTAQTPPPEAAEPIAIPEKPKPQPPQQEAKAEPPPAPILRPNTPQKPKPQKKPPPPQSNDFSSLLKNLTKQQPQQSAEAPIQPQPNDSDTASISALSSPQMTASELDAVRSQIQGCWFLDPGKKGIEEMIVEIVVSVGPDGTVLSARYTPEDEARMGDPAYRAVAEAAYRAVMKCHQLRLPPDKYETWKDLRLHFNPSGVLG